jgi:type II secretory pathway component GspD/PulD (secretin)
MLLKSANLLKFFGFILFLLVFTSSFAELMDLTYVKTSSEIVIIVSFTKTPTVQYYSRNGSKTVHFFVVNDTCVSPIYLPINAESVDAVQVIPFRDAANLFVYTLTPVSATYNVTGSRLYIRLPLSTSAKRMTANFTSLKSEVVFKDLADFFGINLVLYDSAKGKLVNTRVNNSTIEQILRNLLTLTGLSYAYSEDQTLYIGSQEDIEKTFALNFQIPRGKVSVEELSKLFMDSIYALPLSDKSKLFTYGGSNEYKILASAIGLAAREAAKKMEPKPTWYYFSYTADEKELEGFLEKLKKIYDFDFVLLPEIKQLALNGTDYEKVWELVKTLKPAQKPAIETQYKTFTTEYPQRVAEFLKQLYKDINVEVIGDKLYVSTDYENVVKKLLEDPVIARPWRVMFSDTSEDTVKTALSYLDIAEPNYIVKSYDNTVYVTLFVNEKKYKEFLDLVNTMSFTTATVKVDEAFLKSFNVAVVQTFSDGSKLVKGKIKEIERLKKAIEESITNVVIKAEPSDPSKDVISKVLGYPVDITTDGYWIITVPKQESSTIQEKFKSIRENFGKSIITLSGRYDENAVEIAKKIYGVEIYTLSDKLIIYGTQSQNAKQFLEKLTVENFIVPAQISLSNVHIDYVRKVYNVEVIYFPEMNKAVVFGPSEPALRAAAYLKSLSMQSDLESLKLSSSLKKEDLEKLSSLLELNVKVEVIGDTAYLKGSKNDIEKLVEEINKLSQSPEMTYDVISYDESLDEILRKIYNVQTYKIKSGYIVYGTKEQIQNVKTFLGQVKLEEIRILNTQIEEAYLGIIRDIYDSSVRYYKIGDKVYLIGKKESLDKIAEEVSVFEKEKGSLAIETFRLGDNVKLEDVTKLRDLLSLKIEAVQIGDALYLKGKQNEIAKLKSEIEKLTQSPELKYELINYDEVLDSVVKELYGVKTYKVKSGYIVYGTQEQLASVKSFVSGFSTQLEVRTLTTKLEARDIETIISVYDPNVKHYKIGDKVYLVGKKESLDKIEKEMSQFDAQSEYNIINGKLLIEVTNKNLAELVMKVSNVFKEQVILVDELKTNVTLRLLVADFRSFVEYLQTFGVTYKQTDNVYLIYSAAPQRTAFQGQQQTQPVQPEEVIVKDGLITINASNKNVTDIVSQVLSKLGKSYKIDDVQTKVFSVSLNNIDFETFKSVFSEWVDIKEIGNVVYVSKPISVSESKVSVKNGKISVKIDNEPLGNVIKSVFESFGYPIIFSKQINTTATMSLSEIDFDTFTSILLNYGIAIKKSGNVYVVDTTPEATKTKTTYTFNVTRGADKVKALIEFYGGKAMVNTDAGIVIAYDLDPKNVDDIRNVIDKVSKVRVVSIETKVVDESLLSSLGFDISTILSSADYLSIGTGGLSLKFKIVDFMDLQALWNKIIDEAQIQIKTSGNNVPAPYGTSGGGKLLANPNIMAKSGEQARIFIGDSIPVVITSEGKQTLNYLEAGIELRITPSINLDDTIDLDLYTTVGNFDYSVVVAGFPKQNKREVQTKITLKNGQTLIIGGLAREEVSKSEWKIPILGDLPIIGWLFKGVQEKTEQRNIVIFLTAKIIEQ